MLSPGGRLASEKTFSRADVIVAVAPHMHGLPVSVLDSGVDKVLTHEDAIALPLVSRAREPVWAAACVVEDERRQAWAIGKEAESSLGELYAEQMRLLRAVPPDLSDQLEHVRRRSHAVERDIADLYDGTGRWAHTGAGLVARAVREAAIQHQRAEELLESPELGRWSRHKARRALAAAGDRFDKALAAWEGTGEPIATRLEGQRGRLGAEIAQLEQARTSREEFLAQHPEVPSRLAQLDRVIERRGRK